MRKLFLLMVFMIVVISVPLQSIARVDVRVNIGLPPPIAFVHPPEVVVLPHTHNVYVVPGLDMDLFFWNGWWWRPWQGNWYRSHNYDHGWVFYNTVPPFYVHVDPGWRTYYRSHNWRGSYWNYRPIPHHELRGNWRKWDKDRFWEKRHNWGVRVYAPPRPRDKVTPQDSFRPRRGELPHTRHSGSPAHDRATDRHRR